MKEYFEVKKGERQFGVAETSQKLSLLHEIAESRTDHTRFLDWECGVAILHGNLPHWRQSNRTYFVTFRFADALPAHIVQRTSSDSETDIDVHLDASYGASWLKHQDVREVVRNSLLYFEGNAANIHAWASMPNHVHLLLTMRDNHNLSKILQRLKSYTARQINGLTGESGPCWQKESFDHIIRDLPSYASKRAYIIDNPRFLANHTFEVGIALDV